MADVSERFANAAEAQRTLTESVERHRAILNDYQNSVAGHFLGRDVDPVTAVGNILRSGTAQQQMADLGRMTANDPTARQAIQTAVIKYMTRQMTSPNAISSTNLQETGVKMAQTARFLQEHVMPEGKQALSHILNPDQMKALQNLALDIRRSGLSNQPVTAGSPTALNESAKSSFQHPQSMMGAVAALEMMGDAGEHLLGGIPGGKTVGLVATLLGKTWREHGLGNVDDMVAEAVLHPDKMKALLAKMPDPGQMNSRMMAVKGQMAAMAAAALNGDQQRIAR
jgi:hypothetical protein